MIKSNRAFHLLSIWFRQYLKNNENEIKETVLWDCQKGI